MEENLRQAFRDVVRGAGVTTLGMGLEYLLAFVAQVIAATYLSVESFGAIITGTAIIDVGMLVGSVGLGTGVARYLPRQGDDATRLGYVHSAFGVAAVVSVVVGGLVALNASFISNTLIRDDAIATTVLVFGLTIPFAALLRLAVGGIRGQGVSRYRVYVRNVVQPLSRFLLVVLASVLGLGQVGFAVAYAIPYVVAGALAVWLLRAALDGFTVLGRVDRAKTRELVDYSAPQSVASLAWFLVRSMDVFLVGALVGIGAVGVYGVAYGLARTLLIFSTAFNFLGMPASSVLDQDEDRSKMIRVNEFNVRWLFLVSIPAVFPFVAYPSALLEFVYRPEYATGGTTLAVLALAFLFHNALSPASTMLQSTGRTRYHMLNNVSAAALNLGLNLLLLPRLGILGAAVASFAAYIGADLLANAEIRYFEGASPLSTTALAPAVVGLPLLAAWYWLAARFDVWLPVALGLTAALGVVYAVAFVAVAGFEDEEALVVREAQRRFDVELRLLNRFLDRFS